MTTDLQQNDLKKDILKLKILFFSGLVIAKLLAKEEPHQVQTLNDLRQMKDLTIVIKKNSFVEDLFAKSDSMQDLRTRIRIEAFDTGQPEALRCQFHQHFTRSFFVQKSFEQLFCTYALGLYFLAQGNWRKSCS